MTYSDLVASVLRRLGPEKGDAASGMRRYVQMAEDQLYRRLRHRRMEEEADLTPDGAGEATLPDNFISLIGITQGGEEVPSQASRLEAKNPASGPYYFIIDRTLFTSGVQGSVSLRYYRRFPSLLEASDDRYVMLDEEPELFVNATVTQAMQDLNRPNEYAFELSKLLKQIDEVNERSATSTTARRRVSGLAMYSGRIGG